MDFELTIKGERNLSTQIYRALRSAILGGRLRPAQELPSTRELASQLCVARKTVLRAYERLSSESLIQGHIGSGTFVRAGLQLARELPKHGSVLVPRPEWLRVSPSRQQPERPVKFDFSIGTPDVSLFPFSLWRSLLASSGRVLGASQGHYGDPQGDMRLREAISQYVAFTRAVVCRPDEIIITRGAQHAVDLLARVLLSRGDTAVVEEPGYPPVRDLLALNGIEVVSVDVDSEGLQVQELPAKARMVYVTPSHQFPLGMPMSLDRKIALLRWAAKRQACIIEDDYDSEYRFEPRPLESLQSLDRHGVVAYIGTFSKIMHPGLRIGFIVAPRSLVPALTQARRLNDSNESALLQHALTRFISEGHLARHIRRMSKVYGRRRAKLLEMLTRFSGVFGNVVPSVAGLHVACLHKTAKQASELLRRGELGSARFAPLSRFSSRPGRPGVVFGYGAIPEDSIGEGIKAILAFKKGEV